RTLLDIGGQDSKAIGVDPWSRRVTNFRMNDKCAAGTGRFLEVMAERLGLDMERMIQLALDAKEALEISSVCTVFAETEVVSMVAQGKPIGEILRGLHMAVINRVYPMLRDVGIKPDVVMTGGVAKNKAIVRLLEDRLKLKVFVPPDPQLTGALGAALIAMNTFD
ncbi:MAG: acyl-CoA dehydratase activase, partial [Desulfatiglandales bacterium]